MKVIASPRKAMKVLIGEDHVLMRQMIRAVVADLAEAISECTDGSEVVAAYTREQYSRDDRVLMDLQIPGMDGLEATRRLRAAFPDAQVSIVTQYGDSHLREAAKQAGASGYVLKENLLELRRLLERAD